MRPTVEEIRAAGRRLDTYEKQLKALSADLNAKIAVDRHFIERGLGWPAEVSPLPPRLTLVRKSYTVRKPNDPAEHLPRRQRAIVEHILSTPGADYVSLVPAVYGDESEKSRMNAHSTIWNMKQKSVLKGKQGSWDILEPYLGWYSHAVAGRQEAT